MKCGIVFKNYKKLKIPIFAAMARKILVVYAVYTVIVFLINTYVIKENYTDALLKAVLSGVVFAALYAIVLMRNEKRQNDEKEAAAKNIPTKKKK